MQDYEKLQVTAGVCVVIQNETANFGTLFLTFQEKNIF